MPLFFSEIVVPNLLLLITDFYFFFTVFYLVISLNNVNELRGLLFLIYSFVKSYIVNLILYKGRQKDLMPCTIRSRL